MPTRLIREGILTSDKIAALDWGGEVFYRRLMSVVDDYGRTEYGEKLLRSKCYPLQIDVVQDADVKRWVDACLVAGLVTMYQNGDKRYLEINNFNQQTRSKSKCPAPNDNNSQLLTDDNTCKQLLSDVHLDGDGDGGVLCTEQVETTSSEPAIIEIPLIGGKSYGVTQSDINGYSEIYGSVDVLSELKRCRQWNIDNPRKRKTHSGVKRHINTWLGSVQDKPKTRQKTFDAMHHTGGGVVL